MSDSSIPARGQVAYDASAAIALSTAAQHCLANVSAFAVDSPEMLAAAADDLRGVKALQKRVEDQRTSITGPLNAALRAVNDLFRPAGEYLKEAESVLKRSMLAYTAEQERLAHEARAKAEAEAAAERQRLAEIQRAQDDAARQAAAEAQRMEAQAQAAEAAGDHQAAAAAAAEAQRIADVAQQAQAQADATAMDAAVLSMPVAVEAPAKAKGVAVATSVDFSVTDKMALIQHVAAHPELADLLTVDSVKMRAQVRATGMNTRLPGVSVFPRRTMSARAA